MSVDTTKNRKEYTGTAGRILKYLSSGCNDVQTAHACGVDPSYVSQLKAEPEFQEQVAEALRKAVVDAQEIDQAYIDIEKEAVTKLKMYLGYMQSPDQLLRVLKTVNGAQKKIQQTSAINSENISDTVPVRLMLPNVLVQNFIVNPNQEVVQVGERTLTTLNSKSMESLLTKHRASVTIESKPVKKVLLNGKDPWSDL